MAPMKNRYRTIYLVTAALMVAMIGGYALAATSTTTLSPAQNSNVTGNSPNGFTGIASISSEQLVVLTAGMTGSATAGVQTGGAIGISGATTALTACAVACTQNFKTANPATETTGDYGEQLVMTVSQPLNTGTSLGFDFSITVLASTGNVVAQGYLATGLATGGTGSTVTVFLFVDLGTVTAPSVTSVSVVFNQCSSAAACP